MKTLLFCLTGFETMEFSPFIDILGWARNNYNCDVTVDTCGFKREVISTFGVPIITDKVLDEIDINNYDALAIPGGFEEYGFYSEAYDERFLRLIREFDRKHKPIATVCVGALPLGKSGILKGRTATTYHLNSGYRQKQLAAFGVNVINEPVFVDDNIITSHCPQTAPYVGFELLKKLTDNEVTQKVMEVMGYSKNKN